MNETQPKNRGGRPQKFPGEGPRITHATRLRPATAARLAEEADRNHRSLGEEIEFRINKSFDGLVLTPPNHLMHDLGSAAKANNRSIEDEAIGRISENHVAEIVKSALLSDDFAQKQASIMTNFMRQQRIGIIIGRLLAIEADTPLPPYSEGGANSEDRATARLSILDEMEKQFEAEFGIGSINTLVEKYDAEVVRLVQDASKGKYVVISGRIQEIKHDQKEGSATLFFTGERVPE